MLSKVWSSADSDRPSGEERSWDTLQALWRVSSTLAFKASRACKLALRKTCASFSRICRRMAASLASLCNPKITAEAQEKNAAYTHASQSMEKNSAQHRKQVRTITKTTCGTHLLPSSKQCKQGSNARQDAEKNARLQKQRYKQNNATSSPNLLQCQQQKRKHHQHGRARWSHLLRQHQTVLPRSWFCETLRSNASALRTA